MIRNRLSDIWELLKLTFSKAGEDDIVTQGAAIAFYTIFSIAPLIVLIVSLGSLFLNENIIREQLGNVLDDNIVEDINQYLGSRDQERSGFLTSVIALATVVFGATTVISQIKSTLNRIWNVAEIRIHSVWNFLLSRLISFGMILLFSLLLLISLLAEATLGLLAGFFSDLLPYVHLNLYSFLSQLSTIIFAILCFTLLFKILPDVHVRWADVLIGALVTTLFFLLGKYLIGIYLSAANIDVTYRTAGTLVVFVIWVYYNIQTILLGAVFTQVYTEKYGGDILPYRYVSLEGIARTMKNKESGQS